MHRYLGARAPSNTCIRQQREDEEDDRGGRLGMSGEGEEGTPSGKPGGNTASPAQAVPSALVIFPFYAFHSFVSLRMLAPALRRLCVRASARARSVVEERRQRDGWVGS